MYSPFCLLFNHLFTGFAVNQANMNVRSYLFDTYRKYNVIRLFIYFPVEFSSNPFQSRTSWAQIQAINLCNYNFRLRAVHVLQIHDGLESQAHFHVNFINKNNHLKRNKTSTSIINWWKSWTTPQWCFTYNIVDKWLPHFWCHQHLSSFRLN